MQAQAISFCVPPTNFLSKTDGQFWCRQASSVLLGSICGRGLNLTCALRHPLNDAIESLASLRIGMRVKQLSIKSVIDGSQEYSVSDDEDNELCPVECVREFQTDEEFFQILEKAKRRNALVVVDFYRTSCGSCKYIERGFSKLCKASGDDQIPVIFLKHNVLDEYDEQSEVAERLRIRTVPLFHFYRNGTLLEAFPTRDKERIIEAILKYTSPRIPTPHDV